MDSKNRFLLAADALINLLLGILLLLLPSGWQPGDTTLTPGPDLVGKVWEVWKP